MPLDLLKIASNINLNQDGSWTSQTYSNISYPESGNESCFAVEDSSFWFRHRNDCILQAVESFAPSGTFFDIGGGNGYVARRLQEKGIEVVLVEPGPIGVRNALKRGIRHVIRSTVEDAGFSEESLPAVGLFDVVEHTQDDRAFLTRINHLLIPGGRVYITVPALQWLWSQEDKDAGHYRRYTLQSLSRCLENCGYEVELATYFFGFLFTPILVVRVLPYRLGFKQKEGNHRIVSWNHTLSNRYVDRSLEFLTRRELSRISARTGPRIGGSCLVVARKSSE